jgi:hypothetical protein
MCLKRPVRVLREIERIAQGCLKLSMEQRFAYPRADQGLENGLDRRARGPPAGRMREL